MNIHIITVGKLKESYWREASAEYLKRLSAYANVSVIEVKEAKTDSPASVVEEGEYILNKLPQRSYKIALAINGERHSSESLAHLINTLTVSSLPDIAFIIGGSHGLSGDVLNSCDKLLSFSPMTFPHQLMRVILLEQIYRGFKIIKGEPYHK